MIGWTHHSSQNKCATNIPVYNKNTKKLPLFILLTYRYGCHQNT